MKKSSFLLVFAFSLLCMINPKPAIALSGEFISDSGLVDKIELAGASAIITLKGISKSYLLSEKDGYITLVGSSDRNEHSGIITLKIIGNGSSLLCKSGDCQSQIFKKFEAAEKSNPLPLTGFCPELIPKKPEIAYTTSNNNGVKIHITGNFISKLGDGDKDMAMAQVSQILLNCALKEAFNGHDFKDFRELCFDFDGSLQTLYVKDEPSLERVIAATDLGQKWKIMKSYSEQWGSLMLPTMKASAAKIDGIGAALLLWNLRYNDYVYGKFFEDIPNVPKLRSQVHFGNRLKDLDFLNKFGLLFVVCDENWEPKCWVDYYKDFTFGEAIIKQKESTKKEDILKIYQELIKNDSTNNDPVFLVEDVVKTTEYYVNVLGFKYAKHYDKKDKFATIYRDSIEIVLVEKLKGEIESNKSRYGNGFDAYIDADSIEGVDIIYQDYKAKNVKIISGPQITEYGSYEFVFQDIDGRNIGVGLIADKKKYFENSNILNNMKGKYEF